MAKRAWCFGSRQPWSLCLADPLGSSGKSPNQPFFVSSTRLSINAQVIL